MQGRWLSAVGAAVALGLAMAVAPSAAFAADHAGATIIVGADTTFPPFEAEVGGKVTGFDIDMIRDIAKAEDLKVDFKTMPFNGIIPGLQVGSVNAAVAGITITKSRMQSVDFSDAYYLSGLSVLVRKDSPIKGFSDLKGHVVATKKATSSVAYLQTHGFDMGNVRQFANIDAAYQALLSDGADAVIFDNPVNLNFELHEKDKVKIVGDLLTGEYYGVAVSKKNPWLVAKMNAGLKKIRANGEYDKLFDKYFGGDAHGKVTEVKAPASVATND
ncbi:MAG TPA: basic amino acid ABC transporter substrate-binding protein [Nevskiaceae bacterium]